MIILSNACLQQMFESKLQFRGIIRNKISELNHLKGRKKVPIKRFSKAALRKTVDDQTVIKSSLLSEQTKPSEMEMTFIEEPSWMTNYKECSTLLREVDILQGQIAKEKLKKMSAVCEKKHDRVIQQFVEEATTKLNRCQKKLKQMENASNFDPSASPAQRRTFTSMVMSMATNIRDQARKLRGQQQSQLRRQRELKNSAKNILQMTANSSNGSEIESWLSQQQFQDMQKSMMRERDEEVTKILQSIYSLNGIYKELQGLVIEQGSLLDRIDQNVENAVQSVSLARKNLEEAKDKQQSNCLKTVRRTLILLIMLTLLIFFIKHV